MIKRKKFSDEGEKSILFELEKMKSSLLKIAQYPTSDNVDKNDVSILIEKYLNAISEFEKAVKE